MPRVKINYQNTIIYKIVSIDKPEIFFIGSTTEYSKRKNLHKTGELKGFYEKLHQIIIANGGWDKFKMLEISKFPCIDKNEADAEVFRIQTDIKMQNLNKQFEVDNQRIQNQEHVIFKHNLKQKRILKLNDIKNLV